MAPGSVPADMRAPGTRGLASRLFGLAAGSTGTMTYRPYDVRTMVRPRQRTTLTVPTLSTVDARSIYLRRERETGS
jgi:hypothetical protein